MDPGQDAVPDLVQQFVVYFYRHIRERNLQEIYTMYDNSWNKLSDRYFKTSPWPRAESVMHLAEDDHIFVLLYKEMWFRHLYAKGRPTLAQRAESWQNYCNVFDIVINSDLNILLPNAWLWDMIDEFVYQFQSFCQYRAKLKNQKPEEIETIKGNTGVWSTVKVLEYLQKMVDKSGIKEKLAQRGDAFLIETEGYTAQTSASNVLPVLGYMAMIGQLKMHTIFGDYYGGLKAIGSLNLKDSNSFLGKITGCHIATHYHAGFCFMMMKQYADAVQLLNSGLVYVARVKQYLSRSAGYDQILQKMEQMYALLAISVSLCPSAASLLEETVQTNSNEKHREKINRMTRNYDVTAFDDLFTYGCPKFITPAPPSYEDTSRNFHQDAFKCQQKLFLKHVQQDPRLPALRQYLKLYTSISLQKLAGMMDLPVAELEVLLLGLKSKNFVKGYTGLGGGDKAGGVSGDVQFDLDVDSESGDTMVNVTEVRVEKQSSDFFLRHIQKMDAISKELSVQVAAQTAAH